MTWEPESCTPQDDSAHAAMIMWRRDCGIVPVVERGTNRLVGVVTDRDICIAAAMQGRPPGAVLVGEIMTPKPHACLPDDDLKSALKTMADTQTRRLPVADAQGTLCGIVSMNDLILHAEKTDRRGAAPVTYAEVMTALRAVSRHRQEAVVAAPH